jgi:hypothetical protein
MGQSFDDVHAVYCYFGSGIILSGVKYIFLKISNIKNNFSLIDSTSKNS